MQRDLTACSVLSPLLNTEREITTFHALLFIMPGLPITYNDLFHGVGSHALGTSIPEQGGLARIRKTPGKFRPGA